MADSRSPEELAATELLSEASGVMRAASAQIRAALDDADDSDGVDRSGRVLAGRSMPGNRRSAAGDQELFGDTLMEAMQSVQSGQVASAYVDPFTAKVTDLVAHEQGAAKYQLRSGVMGGGGMYASLTDVGPAGVMVPIELKAPVFTLRAGSVVLGLPGIRVVPQNSDRMRFPRIAGVDAAGADIAQAGVPELVAITETTPDVDAVDMIPVKFGVYHLMSSEWVQDATPQALAAFSENAIIQLGLKIDLGMLEGNGAGQLVGLRNTPGVSTTSVAGIPADFDKLADTLYAALAANANATAWVMHPRSWNTLSKIKTGIASDKTTLLNPDPQTASSRSLLGLPVYLTTQPTLVEGATNVGSWVAAVDASQLVVGVRRSPLVEFSRDVKFQEDGVAMKVTARYSFGVLNPAGVSIATDVRP